MKVSTLFLFLAATAQAANIDIEWSIKAYEDITAQVGDTITFTWGSGHNVLIHPTGTCDVTDAILIGETSPAVYTFTAEDVGQELFFVCGVGGHCDAGQHITVAVTDAVAGSGVPTAVPVEGGTDTTAAPTVTPLEGGSASAVPSAIAQPGIVSAAPSAATEAESGNGSTAPGVGSGSESPSIEGGSTTQAPTASSGAKAMSWKASVVATASALAWYIL